MEDNTNKEFLEEEQTSEEKDTSVEDTNSLESEETNISEDTNTEENTDVEADEESSNVNAKPVKSKMLIQFPLIIAAGILVAAILAFGIWKVFFDTTIEGTWVWENLDNTATADQADMNIDSNLYINFTSNIIDEEYEYKEIIAYQGTQEQHAYYLLEESEEGTKSLQSSFGLAGNYEITGNWITGRTLTITATRYDGSEIQQVFRSTGIPNMALPPVSEDFKVVDDIIGEWTWSETGYDVTYTFNTDGSFVLNQYDEAFLKGTYTVYEDEGEITLTYIGQGSDTFGVQNFNIVYEKDGDTLVIDGRGYTKAQAES